MPDEQNDVQAFLHANKKVTIAYIHCPPEVALARQAQRLEATGRAAQVSLKALQSEAQKSMQGFLELGERYGAQDLVRFIVANNSSTHDRCEILEGNQAIDFLRKTYGQAPSPPSELKLVIPKKKIKITNKVVA